MMPRRNGSPGIPNQDGRKIMSRSLFLALVVLVALSCCRHKVDLQAPKEPIVINMNIRIQHELRIKVDKEVDDLLENNEDLFGDVQ